MENKTIDYNKQYNFQEAIKILKENNKLKFDPSIELHIRLGIDPKKSDQHVRAAVNLPHGTGKTIKVAAFVSVDKEELVKKAGADLVGSDDLIAEIKKSEKTDFDVAVAEPAMMKSLAPIAKILGTRGLMPSPKNETISANPEKVVAELKKGKISFKNDETGNLHLIIGKLSFTEEKLEENFKTIIETIKKNKPASSKGTFIKNISICTSMSKAFKLLT